MNNNNWIKLIESKRDELYNAIRDAEEQSLRNSMVYNVWLYADGEIETWQELPGHYHQPCDVEAVRISSHDNRSHGWTYEDSLEVSSTKSEIIASYKSYMTDDQAAEFDAWLAEYEEEPVAEWIEEHAPSAAKELEDAVISDLMADYDPDSDLDRCIGRLQDD